MITLFGCQSGSQPREGGAIDAYTGRPVVFAADPLTVVAAPDDLDAAVSWAMSRASVHMAVVEVIETGPEVRLYRLVTSDDRPAWLRFATASGEPLARSADEPTELRIDARVGRFGDAGREIALLRAVSDRLRALSDRRE